MTDFAQQSNDAADPAREGIEVRTIEPDQVEDILPGPIEGAGDERGTRIENFLSMRTFVEQEEALRIGLQPKGSHVTIGLLAGYVTGFERRESNLPLKVGEKAPPPSIWLKGEFRATVLKTGEIKEARWCILPRAAGELVEEALTEGGVTRALLDLEIGVQATGRTIPYAYTVVAYGRSHDAKKALDAIEARQEARRRARGAQALLGRGSASDAA